MADSVNFAKDFGQLGRVRSGLLLAGSSMNDLCPKENISHKLALKSSECAGCSCVFRVALVLPCLDIAAGFPDRIGELAVNYIVARNCHGYVTPPTCGSVERE